MVIMKQDWIKRLRAEWPVALFGALITGLLAGLFYRSSIAVLMAVPVGAVLTPLLFAKTLEDRKSGKKAAEFSLLLQSLSTALRAGKSLENAIPAAGQITRDGQTPLLGAMWEKMEKAIEARVPAEEALKEFAGESGLIEARNLAEVIAVSRKSRGNLSENVSATVQLIKEKLETEAEIRVLLAEKRAEALLMLIIVPAVIIMLGIAAPDYAAPLFNTLRGRLVMTVALAVYLLSLVLTVRLSKPKW